MLVIHSFFLDRSFVQVLSPAETFLQFGVGQSAKVHWTHETVECTRIAQKFLGPIRRNFSQTCNSKITSQKSRKYKFVRLSRVVIFSYFSIERKEKGKNCE